MRLSVNGTRTGQWDVVQSAWYSSVIPHRILKNTSLLSLDFQLSDGESRGSAAVSKELGVSSVHFAAIALAPQDVNAEFNVDPTVTKPPQQSQVLLTDPGFEDKYLSAWLPWLDVTSSRSHSGSRSLAESGGTGNVYQDTTGLEPGRTYTITAWISGEPSATAPGQITAWNPGQIRRSLPLT